MTASTQTLDGLRSRLDDHARPARLQARRPQERLQGIPSLRLHCTALRTFLSVAGPRPPPFRHWIRRPDAGTESASSRPSVKPAKRKILPSLPPAPPAVNQQAFNIQLRRCGRAGPAPIGPSARRVPRPSMRSPHWPRGRPSAATASPLSDDRGLFIEARRHPVVAAAAGGRPSLANDIQSGNAASRPEWCSRPNASKSCSSRPRTAMRSMAIGHSNSGRSPAWSCDRIFNPGGCRPIDLARASSPLMRGKGKRANILHQRSHAPWHGSIRSPRAPATLRLSISWQVGRIHAGEGPCRARRFRQRTTDATMTGLPAPNVANFQVMRNRRQAGVLHRMRPRGPAREVWHRSRPLRRVPSPVCAVPPGCWPDRGNTMRPCRQSALTLNGQVRP